MDQTISRSWTDLRYEIIFVSPLKYQIEALAQEHVETDKGKAEKLTEQLVVI